MVRFTLEISSCRVMSNIWLLHLKNACHRKHIITGEYKMKPRLSLKHLRATYIAVVKSQTGFNVKLLVAGCSLNQLGDDCTWLSPGEGLATWRVIDTDIRGREHFEQASSQLCTHPSIRHLHTLPISSLEKHFLLRDETLCGRRETQVQTM